jgi:predicted amidohydrolase YtcJ
MKKISIQPIALLASVLVLILATGVKTATAQQADLVITNGKIITLDENKPEVQALATRAGKVIAIGTNEEIKKIAPDPKKTIDLDGELVIPGFIEGHAHFVGLGQSKMMLDLTKATTWDDIVAMVAKAAADAKPGEWIVGRGWHQSKWKTKPTPNVNGYPTDAALSKVSPNNPVLLTHASGHMCFANAYAMRLGGVTSETEPPSGGEILHDGDGQPIGVFRETAQALVGRARSRDAAKMSSKQMQQRFNRAVELAGQECVKKGVTSFQDAGSSLATIRYLKKLAFEKKLPVRLYVMIRDSNDRMEGRLKNYRMIGHGDNFLTVRALKRSIDGALGPHGAWLLMPYSDMPTSSGLNTASVESVTRTAQLAIENDFQCCVHAIGDRANREVLNIYEKLFQEKPSDKSRRWRVEHAQHLHPDDIKRFGDMNVIASMQGVHCTSDAIFVPKRLGERRSKEGAYVWQSLMKAGAVVTNGTDAPVEDVDPLPSFYATVTRKLKNGMEFYPEQKMTRMEALKSYTTANAYAAFEEDIKGTLSVGKLADIVVLSQDILKCSDDKILDTKVLYTIIGGKVVYKAGEKDSGSE